MQYQSGVSEVSIMKPSDCQFGVLDIASPQCVFRGGRVREGQSVKDNCNTCKCEVGDQIVDIGARGGKKDS